MLVSLIALAVAVALLWFLGPVVVIALLSRRHSRLPQPSPETWSQYHNASIALQQFIMQPNLFGYHRAKQALQDAEEAERVQAWLRKRDRQADGAKLTMPTNACTCTFMGGPHHPTCPASKTEGPRGPLTFKPEPR